MSDFRFDCYILNKGIENKGRIQGRFCFADSLYLLEKVIGKYPISFLRQEDYIEFRSVDVHTLDFWVELIQSKGFQQGVPFNPFVAWVNPNKRRISLFLSYELVTAYVPFTEEIIFRESEIEIFRIHAWVVESVLFDYIRLGLSFFLCVLAGSFLFVPFFLTWIYFLRQPGLRPFWAGKDFKETLKKTRKMCDNPLALIAGIF